jgi:PilZ domain
MRDIPSRRKFTRYHCTGGVELRRSEGAPPIFANLSDISLEGCYVEAVSTLPTGTSVLFLLRAQDIQLRGRATVKASNHAVGMGLEFLHLAAEDQQRLEFLVGKLAGTQEMQPAEKRTIIPEDPLMGSNILRPARPAATAPVSPPPRNPAPAGAARSPQPTSAFSQKIMRTIAELNELEQNLVKDRIDPRLIAQLHDAVEHMRQTAWTVQQWVDLHSSGGDPFDVLPQLEAERMHMLGKLAHNVTADIDATSINRYTLGISDLYETVHQLYRRLRKMLVDDAPEI